MTRPKGGQNQAIYFPKINPSKSPHLLPREEADQIPFSSKQLLHLLHFFSFSQDSPQAKALEDTLRQCEIEPIKGETKSCATSLESMLDFTRGGCGLDTPFSVVATTHLTNSTTNFQNYTILEEPKEILAPKMVACHTMSYPYAVLLGGEDGDRVEAVAVCHLDTSQWSPNHASFSVLRTKPGASAVPGLRDPTVHMARKGLNQLRLN
ncbi:unknown seed protein like 1 [Prunus dulcis]|uniref:BURP domain-containing protein n=1 Tax=Prunus dulcis TaxID=3755 RepID=A0A5H2XXF7_PRUDU|nr:unknown seed protein like 1 [Prunus dulcis]